MKNTSQVSTEGPRFRTIARDSVLTVYQPPDLPPSLVITLNQNTTTDNSDDEDDDEEEEEVTHVVPGDRLQAECTSGPAHPAPNLTLQVGNIIPFARNIPVGRTNNAIQCNTYSSYCGLTDTNL